MKRVKIAELKDHLSEHLRAVEQGARLEVTDRNRPIVRLIPATAQTAKVRVLPARRSGVELRSKRYPRARWPVRSLELLQEERGKR